MKFSFALRSALPAAALGILALGLVSAPAFASTTTSNTFSVTAFGTYTGAAVQASSTLTVTCTSASTPYNIGLNAGATSGATLTSRQMQISGAGAGLGYTLTSVSYTGLNWGNTLATNWVGGTSSATAQTQTTQTVYGTIPANQLVAPGSYSDTITASITY